MISGLAFTGNFTKAGNNMVLMIPTTTCTLTSSDTTSVNLIPFVNAILSGSNPQLCPFNTIYGKISAIMNGAPQFGNYNITVANGGTSSATAVLSIGLDSGAWVWNGTSYPAGTGFSGFSISYETSQ